MSLRVATCAAILAVQVTAQAQSDNGEDGDLSLIPQLSQSAPSPSKPAVRSNGRFYLEDAFTKQWLRGDLVVPFPDTLADSGNYTWQNRTSLDAVDRWQLAPRWSFSLSGRLNVFEESDFDLDSSQTVRSDLREAVLSWEPVAQSYLEVGRINQKAGVALGFNPTDLFRTRTLEAQASLDPSALRQNRLGAFMARAQRIWDGGSVSLVYAPELQSPRALQAAPSPPFDVEADRTNGSTRLLLALSWDVADLSPQASLFREGNQTRIGFSVSRSLGTSVVAYAEWAGGRQLPEAAQARAFSILTGTPPPPGSLDSLGGTSVTFRNDMAAGASWSGVAKVTLNLEFHYHQDGFSRGEWQNWFDAGAAQPNVPQVAQALWYIRTYAADRQDPMSQRRIFLRGDWTDAFVSRLELSGFAVVDTDDASSLAQLAAQYACSDHWSVAAYVAKYFGGRRSEYGSQPRSESAIAGLTYYF
jgi:hypothetical protein